MADLCLRVGNHNPRNIYLTTGDGERRDGDEHIGVMFDPDHARWIVQAVNGATERPTCAS